MSKETVVKVVQDTLKIHNKDSLSRAQLVKLCAHLNPSFTGEKVESSLSDAGIGEADEVDVIKLFDWMFGFTVGTHAVVQQADGKTGAELYTGSSFESSAFYGEIPNGHTVQILSTGHRWNDLWVEVQSAKDDGGSITGWVKERNLEHPPVAQKLAQSTDLLVPGKAIVHQAEGKSAAEFYEGSAFESSTFYGEIPNGCVVYIMSTGHKWNDTWAEIRTATAEGGSKIGWMKEMHLQQALDAPIIEGKKAIVQQNDGKPGGQLYTGSSFESSTYYGEIPNGTAVDVLKTGHKWNDVWAEVATPTSEGGSITGWIKERNLFH